MIGINAGYAQVIALGDSGLPSGPTVNLAPPSEGPEMPTLTALDTGLAAVSQRHPGAFLNQRMAGQSLAEQRPSLGPWR